MRHTGAPYGSIPNSPILRGPCVSPSLELRESGKLKDNDGEGCHGLQRQSSRNSGTHSKGSSDRTNRRGCGASQNGSATHAKGKTSSGLEECATLGTGDGQGQGLQHATTALTSTPGTRRPGVPMSSVQTANNQGASSADRANSESTINTVDDTAK